MQVKKCICIKCDKEMDNFANKGLQPIKGLAFMTRGHYGSSFFDPMDMSYLEVAICDECIEKADKVNKVYWGHSLSDGSSRQ